MVGKNIEKLNFCETDFTQFEHKLQHQLSDLKTALNRKGFGDELLKIGAELEMYLVDNSGRVSLSNQVLLDELNDPQFQPELNQYNLELNLSAFSQKGKPFSQLRNEIIQKTAYLEEIAAQRGVNIVPIGILPTIEKESLNSHYMTNNLRYRCLSKHLYQQRGEAFSVNINGEEPLSVDFNDICAEGANTSFQVHFMTSPEDFANTFNAAQLTLPLVTAVGANSSVFLGHKLWDETRIALFKQSLDIRQQDSVQWQQPTRVNFGHGWVRKGPYELFAEAVALYQPILPEIKPTEEFNNDDSSNKNSLPDLSELNLHMGTIWPWHRPVYDSHGNGHVRIEFRAIPAGPTSIDMVSNAAFAIGLAAGMKSDIEQYLDVMPFRFAEYNFYRAAQFGLDAKILWPLHNKNKPEEVSLIDVLKSLIPIAHQGLISLGVDSSEVDSLIAVIEERIQRKITGAIWQRKTLTELERNNHKQAACQQLVKLYLQNCRNSQPVSTWEQIWT